MTTDTDDERITRMTTEPTTMPSGTSASEAFDRLLVEAIDISRCIATELADGEFPKGLHWGHVGDMAETVKGLREASDRIFAEGEHANDRGTEAFLDGQDCAGFTGENAWGTCSRCGRRLEDHAAEPARR